VGYANAACARSTRPGVRRQGSHLPRGRDLGLTRSARSGFFPELGRCLVKAPARLPLAAKSLVRGHPRLVSYRGAAEEREKAWRTIQGRERSQVGTPTPRARRSFGIGTGSAGRGGPKPPCRCCLRRQVLDRNYRPRLRAPRHCLRRSTLRGQAPARRPQRSRPLPRHVGSLLGCSVDPPRIATGPKALRARSG
jgi:hypothetical protein